MSHDFVDILKLHLQMKLTGIFSEMAWGVIRYAFEQIELEPEAKSDEKP